MHSTGGSPEGSGPDEGAHPVGTNDHPTRPLDVEGGPHVHLRYRPTVADFVRLNGYQARQSRPSLVLAGFIIVLGAGTIVAGDMVGVLPVLFGLGLASGLLIMPFVWFTVRRRSKLLLVEVDFVADPAGLAMTTAVSTSRVSWSVFRRVRETGDAVLLDRVIGPTIFILKRGADPAQITVLRSLLDAAGLRVGRSSRLRPLLTNVACLVLGAAVVPGFVFLLTLGQTRDANASISLSASVSGRTVAVRGTTDLPDRSSVVVDVVQLDEWDRARAEGAAPDMEDSPWVIYTYVTVDAGTFAASFDVPAWPSGRASAGAFFWMRPDQPASAAERYGPDGGSMKGPNVVQTTDRGRMLEVRTTFQLP